MRHVWIRMRHTDVACGWDGNQSSRIQICMHKWSHVCLITHDRAKSVKTTPSKRAKHGGQLSSTHSCGHPGGTGSLSSCRHEHYDRVRSSCRSKAPTLMPTAPLRLDAGACSAAARASLIVQTLVLALSHAAFITVSEVIRIVTVTVDTITVTTAHICMLITRDGARISCELDCSSINLFLGSISIRFPLCKARTLKHMSTQMP